MNHSALPAFLHTMALAIALCAGATPAIAQEEPLDLRVTTAKGCILFTTGYPDSDLPEGTHQSWEWDGQCQAGKPVNGKGRMIYQATSDGSAEVYSGIMIDGHWNGPVTLIYYDIIGGHWDDRKGPDGTGQARTYNHGCRTDQDGCTPGTYFHLTDIRSGPPLFVNLNVPAPAAPPTRVAATATPAPHAAPAPKPAAPPGTGHYGNNLTPDQIAECTKTITDLQAAEKNWPGDPRANAIQLGRMQKDMFWTQGSCSGHPEAAQYTANAEAMMGPQASSWRPAGGEGANANACIAVSMGSTISNGVQIKTKVYRNNCYFTLVVAPIEGNETDYASQHVWEIKPGGFIDVGYSYMKDGHEEFYGRQVKSFIACRSDAHHGLDTQSKTVVLCK